MQLHEVSLTHRDGMVRLSGLVTQESNPEPFEIYFAYPEAFSEWVVESADPFVAAMLVPAMFRNEKLIIEPPISPRLHRNLLPIRNAFAAWYSILKPIGIDARPGAPPTRCGEERAATFFSGGVDSYYTALKRTRHEPGPEPLTHLIIMKGIETPLPQISGFEDSQSQVETAARAMGLLCLSGETNIRTFFDRHWERYYVGSGLAATALSLGAGFPAVYIPSSSSHQHPTWTGSNALTDEKFSTEAVQIVWDGAEAGRAEKVRKITEWDAALIRANLRVCHHNQGGAWNCGKCYKCARTALALALLEQLPTEGMFAEDPAKSWKRLLRDDHLEYNVEALALARELGNHPELTRMIERLVNRRVMFDSTVAFIKHSPLRTMLPVLQKLRDQLGIAPREW